MVKVIWHKAASVPHTDGSVIFARWRQCASHIQKAQKMVTCKILAWPTAFPLTNLRKEWWTKIVDGVHLFVKFKYEHEFINFWSHWAIFFLNSTKTASARSPDICVTDSLLNVSSTTNWVVRHGLQSVGISSLIPTLKANSWIMCSNQLTRQQNQKLECGPMSNVMDGHPAEFTMAPSVERCW